VDELTKSATGSVLVRSADTPALVRALNDASALETLNDGAIAVSGLSAEAIGEIALAQGIALHELTPQRASLEEVFMELTSDAVEYGQHRGVEQ